MNEIFKNNFYRHSDEPFKKLREPYFLHKIRRVEKQIRRMVLEKMRGIKFRNQHILIIHVCMRFSLLYFSYLKNSNY